MDGLADKNSSLMAFGANALPQENSAADSHIYLRCTQEHERKEFARIMQDLLSN
jgi:hypothetical protein